MNKFNKILQKIDFFRLLSKELLWQEVKMMQTCCTGCSDLGWGGARAPLGARAPARSAPLGARARSARRPRPLGVRARASLGARARASLGARARASLGARARASLGARARSRSAPALARRPLSLGARARSRSAPAPSLGGHDDDFLPAGSNNNV